MVKKEESASRPAPAKRVAPRRATNKLEIEFFAAMPAIDGLPIEFVADVALEKAAKAKSPLPNPKAR